jgi:hypothetical protein
VSSPDSSSGFLAFLERYCAGASFFSSKTGPVRLTGAAYEAAVLMPSIVERNSVCGKKHEIFESRDRIAAKLEVSSLRRMVFSARKLIRV